MQHIVVHPRELLNRQEIARCECGFTTAIERVFLPWYSSIRFPVVLGELLDVVGIDRQIVDVRVNVVQPEMGVLFEFARLEFGHHLPSTAGLAAERFEQRVLTVNGRFELVDPIVLPFEFGFKLRNAIGQFVELRTNVLKRAVVGLGGRNSALGGRFTVDISIGIGHVDS